MTKQFIKDTVLLKLQEKLGERVTVKNDVERVFTEWFHGLVAGAAILQAPPVEEGAVVET